MTVTPKQLREAADILDAFYSESGAAHFSRQLREAADERDTPVGAVRQMRFGDNFTTYVKTGEDLWEGIYGYTDGRVDRNHGLANETVADAPIIHKPS